LLALSGLEVEPIAVDIGFSRFDLALELELGSSRALNGYFEYDRDLFDAASISGFEQSLRALLAQVAEDPDIPILALGRGAQRPAGHSIRRR
jgi:non-ribosomal peptide synthetase component F